MAHAMQKATLTILLPLRAIADWIDERGLSIFVVSAVMLTGWMLVDPTKPQQTSIGLLIMAINALCIWARNRDNDGHKALRKLDKKTTIRKPSQDQAFLAKGLAYLSLPAGSDIDAIKKAARAIMISNHADTGVGGMDMDKMVSFRDEMVRVASGQANQPADIIEPSRVTKLLAYEKAAGPLGVLWGRMLPSARLKSIGFR